MRTGKQFNTKLKFDNVEIEAHTLDAIHFKTVFIVIHGWFNMEREDVYRLNRKIKTSLYKHMNLAIFTNEKVIDIVDAPRQLTNGYGHSMFEYTLFLRTPNLISPKEMNPYTKQIIEGIYNEVFVNPEFDVKKKKKDIFL